MSERKKFAGVYIFKQIELKWYHIYQIILPGKNTFIAFSDQYFFSTPPPLPK